MNRILKRVISSISVVAMCMCALPVSASAVTYLEGDVDGDGTVTAQDTLILQQFLRGRYGAGDAFTAERLDVDENGIIDINDADDILDIVVGNKNGATFTVTSSNTLPAQSTKMYYVYNAQTGVKIDDYNIEPVSNISTTSASARGIIGIDNREPDYTKSGVVKLSTYSTGFVVGKHTILTSAHCVGGAKKLQITLYNSDGTENSTCYAKTCHIPKEYVDNGHNVSLDYALITVEEDLSSYMCFDLGIVREELESKNQLLYITGLSGQEELGADSEL